MCVSFKTSIVCTTPPVEGRGRGASRLGLIEIMPEVVLKHEFVLPILHDT